MYPESDFLPLSALQHLLFCERQCALIHIERLWADNRLTAEGNALHEKTHEEGDESRGDLRIARGLPLHCARLGLAGVADVVEFHKTESAEAPPGCAAPAACRLPGVAGLWRPFPVEYKRGKPKPNQCDAVQLCAQAICLEEMLGVSIPAGALFYGRTRKRSDVAFDATLRRQVETAALRLHDLIDAGLTPRARRGPGCKNCSLAELCLPGIGPGRSVKSYMARMLQEDDPA